MSINPEYKNLLIRAAPGLHEAVLEIIQRSVLPGSCVLDWGAGQGALSQRLVDAGYKVTAVDLNNEFSAEGAIYRNVDFNDENSVNTFFESYEGSFDAVIGIEVIEHVENPWAYIRQMKNLVKEGGLIVVSTPNPSSWHSRLKFLRDGTYDEFNEISQEGHINPITPWEMRLIMSKSGLVDIGIFPAGNIYSLKKTLFNKLLEFLASLLGVFQRGQISGYCYIAKAKRGEI